MAGHRNIHTITYFPLSSVYKLLAPKIIQNPSNSKPLPKHLNIVLYIRIIYRRVRDFMCSVVHSWPRNTYNKDFSTSWLIRSECKDA